jgi:hypothetical protein
MKSRRGTPMAFEVLTFVKEAKEDLDRTVACKHTSFDDLYPYMLENQSFFWYKRHAAWASLLTAIRIADHAGENWRDLFTLKQLSMITNQILEKQVLDEWLEVSKDESDVTIE